MSYNTTTRKFNIGGFDLEVYPMGSAAIYSHFEDKIKSEYWETVKRASEILEGEDKMQFLKDAMDKEPKGVDLSDACMEAMFSPAGIIEIVSHSIQSQNSLTDEERAAVCQAFDMNEDLDCLRHRTRGS